MTVTSTSEIELAGYKYKIQGGITGAWEDPFPTQMTLGDPDYANRIDLSSWIMNNFSGGIGVEEMDEKKDWNKCWWTDCIIKYPNHILPPRLATELTCSAGTDIPVRITNAGFEYNANWTGGARSSAEKRSGTYSWILGGAAATYTSYQDLAYIPGAAYTITVYARSNITGGADCSVGINDGVDTTWSSATTTESFAQISVTKTLSASATRLRIYLQAVVDTDTYYGYFDDAAGTVTFTTLNDTNISMANFDGDLYVAIGAIIAKLHAARTSLTPIVHLPQEPTAMVASLNSRLYIYQGDTANYWYMDTDDAFTESTTANAYWGWQHDAKLFKCNTSGTVAYSTDPDGAAPTWTSGGAITDIADQIEGFVVGRDASGAYVPYASTNSIIKAYDSTTPQWIDTEARLPNHPIGGKGHAYWNGKLYFSYGLPVKEYYPETGAFVDIGLTERDGLPVEYNGEITKLYGDTGVKGMFAAIDASKTSGNSKSGLYLYDGFGWQCWWTDNHNEVLTTYTEVDASSRLTVTASKATGVDVDSDIDVYLYRDMGVGFFDGLDVKFEIQIDAISTDSGRGGIAITNTVGTVNDFATTDIFVRTSEGANVHYIILIRGNDVASDSYTGVAGTLYYCTLGRTAGSDTVTLKIYSDAARQTLLDTLTVAGFSTTTYRYVYGFVNYNTPTSGADWDGYVQNLNIKNNGAMNDIIVSSASSGYAVYWDCGGCVYYIDIPRGIENPDKITQSYATSGIFLSPWFDAGNPVAAKLAKLLADYAKGVTTTETVALKYRLDHTYTDLNTGWTTLDTLNTTAETGYNEELFASGAGLSYKAIQFRMDFVTAGSTAKADIQSLVFYFKKRTGSEKLRVWNVTLICNGEFNTSAKEKVANLKSAIESTTDVAFSYHPNDASTESYYVTVDCPSFNEQTGREYEANYTLRLIES